MCLDSSSSLGCSSYLKLQGEHYSQLFIEHVLMHVNRKTSFKVGVDGYLTMGNYFGENLFALPKM